ncbi:flagellar biosynthesis repressor FlbT [Hyphomicrobium sp.]|uniref:flagellar biosynthesis repressor FlbT n=1 Tax=Hyphomicrobium sp. TaxID=82 RepID=UPI0025C4A763|nr:flagellar biosynthesis repressor FlbT [Hyphomicrobium sp.]MCC7253303.1 flagellar biosynthesis repressor FlbT [Hyphomicrobium sp.]
MSTTTTRVTLRAGERIFINGAVLKSNGRSSLEILNDVPYLVEHEIMHAQQTSTPLRQLYYILQTMVMEPRGLERAGGVYLETMQLLCETLTNAAVLAGLETIRQQVAEGSPFAALKTLRTLIPVEDAILGGTRSSELRVVGVGQ